MGKFYRETLSCSGRKPLHLFFFLALIILSVATTVYASGEFIELTIKKGDTLSHISEKYLEDPHNWHEVAQKNHLKNPDKIYPGQTLIIPVYLLRGLPINGKVTFINGDVAILRTENGTWEPLNLDDVVKEGASLRTAENSTVEITFASGDSFFLRPNSIVGLTKARRKSGISRFFDLFIHVGRAISKIKSTMGHENRYRIHTPSAVAAARGTEYRVTVDREEATRSEVLAGKVGVEALGSSVEVNKGEGILVKKGKKPAPPRRLLMPPQPRDLQPLYKSLPASVSFNRIDGALHYHVILSTDDKGKSTVIDKIIEPIGTFMISGLEDGKYYLQSRSIDESGLEGSSSEVYALQLRANPLPPFIQEPAPGEEFRDRSINFRWLRVSDGARYHFQLAEDVNFSTIIYDKNELTYTAFKTGKLDYKEYFFRIRSIASDGFAGKWSDTGNFSIIPPPASPSVDIPAIDENKIHIRWQDIGPGIRYHFQMSRYGDFRETVLDTKVDTPQITFDKPEKYGSYFVRTSAIDSEGYEGAFGASQAFDIKSPYPYVPVGAILIYIIVLVL